MCVLPIVHSFGHLLRAKIRDLVSANRLLVSNHVRRLWFQDPATLVHWRVVARERHLHLCELILQLLELVARLASIHAERLVGQVVFVAVM